MCIGKLPAQLFRNIFLLFTLFIGNYANAVFINFDNIERYHPDPTDPYWADQEITDQYLSRGLLVSGGYLNEYGSFSDYLASGPNYLLGAHSLSLTFVGKLPTFVSMLVTAPSKDVAFINATSADGAIYSQETPGWAGPHHESPFQGKNLITFNIESGISRINFFTFYGLRTSVMLDDLTYHYAVPEPTPWLLLLPGLFILISARLNDKRVAKNRHAQ